MKYEVKVLLYDGQFDTQRVDCTDITVDENIIFWKGSDKILMVPVRSIVRLLEK